MSAGTGRLGRLWRGLARTRAALWGGGDADQALSPERIEAIAEALLRADCGIGVAEAVRDVLRRRAAELNDGEALRACLRETLLGFFPPAPVAAAGRPQVILLVGVNGSGKTTTAGKLAARARQAGGRPLLVAADTYRAAAIEQLEVWAERAGAPIVRQREGGDPAAVVVDGLRAARARDADLVLVDTAGRLHTREPLMREIEKVARVAGREVPGAPHEVLLVLDAGTGQNGLAQAEAFGRALPLTGLVLTKLDGTARGGVALAVGRTLRIPIRFVGVGEALEDLLEFSPGEFVSGLLAGTEGGEGARGPEA